MIKNMIRNKTINKYPNIKFTFSFCLECNQDGRNRVVKEIKEFIKNKDWSTSIIDFKMDLINS